MTEQIDHRRLFHGHLLTAKQAFESGRANDDIHATIACYDSMLFECARARRIASHAPHIVEGYGIDPKEFLRIMNDVATLRNIVEHWGDVKEPRSLKMHDHITAQGLKFAVDEASIVVLGPEEIYKGQLNLFDVYKYVVLKLEQMSRH